ncbi:uncharacterized protein BP01DRAFT_361840 [Aspergillus saccharolyticus JOP 1030-1]|uniref:Uncharacterized protein n=1 Tax=Aspergillus saccharolyticus JOP 1030-1 TaxID=1450539 RepID=A0A319AEB2_9EURO|nr:hypothetical protein BP01DRAFT_361840 [Aspergillus saccharolyticus JOP 1030-1]PYH49818.1 hypothetical protein BP01DRAFT_361840 [Aspergillus saccharolyticus JOP 1030-1]
MKLLSSRLFLSFCFLEFLFAFVDASPGWRTRPRLKAHSFHSRQSTAWPPSGHDSNPTCADFNIGASDSGSATGSQVCVAVSGSNVIVTYPSGSWTYNEVHVNINPSSSSPPTGAPGQYNFNSQCSVGGGGSSASCTIPLSAIKTECPSIGCDETMNIITHADVNQGTGTGGGVQVGNAAGKYFNFKFKCPTTSSTSTTTTQPTTTTTQPVTRPLQRGPPRHHYDTSHDKYY